MSQSQSEDQVDLLYVTLQRAQLISLIDGNVVRVDIPASENIPPTVVILRCASIATAARDEVTE